MTSSAGGVWRPRPALKGSYDVVIIGGGSHGLATAYYLRERGITDVCDAREGLHRLGRGRAQHDDPALQLQDDRGRALLRRQRQALRGPSQELNFNLLFSQCGHLTLAHSDRALFVMANRAEVNRLQGIDSRLIGPDEVKQLAPAMTSAGLHLSDHGRPLSPARRHHPPRRRRLGPGPRRRRGGAEIHPYTEVLGLERSNGRVDAVRTNRGRIRAGQVVNATAG